MASLRLSFDCALHAGRENILKSDPMQMIWWRQAGGFYRRLPAPPIADVRLKGVRFDGRT